MFQKPGYSNKTMEALDEEICQSLIGTSYVVASELWNLIQPSTKEELEDAHPKHLLWALLMLKCYCTMPVLTRVVGGVDKKTFRKWAWAFVFAISDLKNRVVSILFGLLLSRIFSIFLTIFFATLDYFPESISKMGRPSNLLNIRRRHRLSDTRTVPF